MPKLAQVIHAKGDAARFTTVDSSGSRCQTCLIVLMTLMRCSAPLNLPPPEQSAINGDLVTFSPS